MQNVYSSAFKVTCAPSHNLLKIHVKMDVLIDMLRIFLQADECVYVMENGSKIKIAKLNRKSYRLSGIITTGKRVASCVFRVIMPGNGER